jgi:hypothetical protein
VVATATSLAVFGGVALILVAPLLVRDGRAVAAVEPGRGVTP